ncbi:hypothetical protein L596_000485 [Steinernema carpocapsae]|uniref:Uncharacterized protein n=1 Tax=Steinernema carpocapsae TaxID=34508 RepID=A0A4U8UKN7_STECR|nr:hypothetical protein L596_000485 [Steinernema carpocapsae]
MKLTVRLFCICVAVHSNIAFKAAAHRTKSSQTLPRFCVTFGGFSVVVKSTFIHLFKLLKPGEIDDSKASSRSLAVGNFVFAETCKRVKLDERKMCSLPTERRLARSVRSRRADIRNNHARENGGGMRVHD